MMKKILCLILISLLLCLTSCTNNTDDEDYITSYKQLENKKIAAWTGSCYEEAVLESIPNASVANLDYLSDMFLSLQKGKVDAVCYEKVLYYNLLKEFPNITVLDDFSKPIDYVTMFGKNEHGEVLRDEYNAFLDIVEKDGRKEKIIQEWIGVDEHVYEGINEWDTSAGSLKVQCGTSTPPFIYICNGQISGYDLALFCEFCKDNHYAVEFETNEYSSLPISVNSGLCDACISGFDYSEERARGVNFSNPTYSSSIVLYTLSDPDGVPEHTSINELDGLKLGLVTGTIDAMVAEEHFPNSETLPYITHADALLALNNKNIDYFMCNKSQVDPMLKNNESIYAIDIPVYIQKIGLFFNKNDSKADKYRVEVNEYLESHKELVSQIIDKWKNNPEPNLIEYNNMGENGTIKLATCGDLEPYTFLRNGEFVGIDIDILNSFCNEKGYKLDISAYDASGTIQAVSSGKVDMGCGGFCITKERSEAVNFSIPYDYEDFIAIVRKGKNNKNVFDSFIESFEKNLIREERWKLVLKGMLITINISIASIVFGSIIGFALYMLCRKSNKLLDNILTHISSLIEGLPIVVVLMILYYVIFAKSSLTGENVSIICFSFSFSLQVYSMLKVAVKSIDIGQEEAAFSIGFKDVQTFFLIVLPQALTQFIPNYRSAMISLLKGTAIVGYIAVQDITKMSDLIRSRTFEAFFPLISTAIIYFLLGKLLILGVKFIEHLIEPKKRSKEMILRKYTK